MNDSKLYEALDEARGGLQDIAEQMRELTSRKDRLEKLVAGLSGYLEINEPLSSMPEPVSVAQLDDDGPGAAVRVVPLWQTARDLLAEVEYPMSVPDMTRILTGRGFAIGSDGLRVAMLRKPDVFLKVGYGIYRLAARERQPASDQIVGEPAVDAA